MCYLLLLLCQKNTQTKGNAMKSVFLPPQALGLSLDTKQYKKVLVYLSRNTMHLPSSVSFSSMLMGAHHALCSTRCLFYLIFLGKEYISGHVPCSLLGLQFCTIIDLRHPPCGTQAISGLSLLQSCCREHI